MRIILSIFLLSFCYSQDCEDQQIWLWQHCTNFPSCLNWCDDSNGCFYANATALVMTNENIIGEINDAFKFAKESPFPSLKDLNQHIYKD